MPVVKNKSHLSRWFFYYLTIESLSKINSPDMHSVYEHILILATTAFGTKLPVSLG